MFPEGLNINGLMQQAQALQAQLQAAQAQMQAASFTGTAGGGAVSATVSGAGELTALEISPDVVDPDDIESLADLIIAAVRDANAQANKEAQASMPQLPHMPF